MAYLEVKNVIKKFGNFTAVDDVSFEARKGEFITLLGPSGCGKTTLLKSIGGFFDDLTSGTIHIDGEVANDIPPEKRNTAMCFQSYALFPHLTVFKNVSFGLEQKKIDKKEINTRVRGVLGQVDMSQQIAKLPSELSGGQQQRVALARAMAVQPGVILFDEPLSNLDAKLRERVRFEIKRLQKEMNFTAVYVTHDQQEALALSDRIIVMSKGKVQQEGSPGDIYNHPVNTFVADFIGTANIMKAQVLSSEGTTYIIDTPLGKLSVVAEDERAQIPGTEAIYVGWRPESVVFLEGDKEQDNGIRATVDQVAFLGTSIHVSAHTENHRGEVTKFLINAPEFFRVGENDQFVFKIVPGKIFFLEAFDE